MYERTKHFSWFHNTLKPLQNVFERRVPAILDLFDGRERVEKGAERRLKGGGRANALYP